MKSISIKSVIAAILLAASTSTETFAQTDAEGCKDHPLFNRLENFKIETCQSNYNSVEFQTGADGKTKSEEGNVTTIRYSFNTESSAKMPSPLQIIKNYENAVISKGGKKVYQGTDDIDGGVLGAVFNFSVKNSNCWVAVRGMYEPSVNGEVGAYTLIVLEKEAMKQEITASEMFNKLNSGNSLTLYINFETGKSVIVNESQTIIDEIYKMMTENPALKITIEGHTDNAGSKASNQTLSEQRAASVKLALVKKGISDNRMISAGFGQDKPIAANDTEEGKAKNRRVEIRKQ